MKSKFFKNTIYISRMTAGRPAKVSRSALGERIAEARLKKGLSQMQLAERLGVKQQVVAGWERTVPSIRSDTLVRIAMELDTTPDQLLGFAPLKSKGPTGRTRKVFDAVCKLTRRQQEKVLDVIEAFVEKNSPNKKGAS